jgi:microcystin-dependent protein
LLFFLLPSFFISSHFKTKIVMVHPFVGTIIMFSSFKLPRGWQYCNGQLLSVSQYSKLFLILGNTYGGDGRTTFALPDLRGRTVVHPSSNISFGEKTGNANKKITADQIPAHTHKVSAKIRVNGISADSGTPVNTYPGNSSKNDKQYSDEAQPVRNMAYDTVSATVSESIGGYESINNMQPYLAVNFIIAVDGQEPPKPPKP